jgi:hypothetical protein
MMLRCDLEQQAPARHSAFKGTPLIRPLSSTEPKQAPLLLSPSAPLPVAASLLYLIIRRFLRDDDVVDVAFPQAG